MLHENGGRNNYATSTFIGRIISQIAGHEELHRGRQCNGQKRFVIRVGQIQIRTFAGINRQTIHVKFGQHFAHALGRQT